MTAQNESEYLIHLLRCAICDTVPEDVPAHISLERVFLLGAVHEVSNIAYTAVKKIADQIPAELSAKWREYYFNAVKRDCIQKKARLEILDALHAQGIYTLEVQGTVVKGYYPQSSLRMMSDLDIIIPADKLDAAEAVMTSLGYETANPIGIEINARRENVVVELHTEFFDSLQAVHKMIDPPFSCAELRDGYTAEVTETVFYLFHLLHTIKHAAECTGVGIRRIIDLYYLENALKGKADFAYIDGVLKKHNVYDIKTKLLAVKDHWFCGIEPAEDISYLEEEILQAGNHGTNEIYFKNVVRQIRARGKYFVKTRYVLGFLFPPKEDIYRSYPFCKKHRYPVLLCWIHRANCSIFSKKKWKGTGRVFSKLKNKF